MSKSLTTHTQNIDGVEFKISVLSVGEARKIFFKIQGILQMHDEKSDTLGMDPSLLAAITSHLKEEDLEVCVAAFAPCTQVIEDDLTFFLKDKLAMDRIFGGRIDLLFAWVSACIHVNFSGVIEKMRAAAKRDQETKAAARSAQSQSNSPRE